MTTNNNSKSFPWGIYIGDLIDDDNTIPVCLPSDKGGFCIIYDEKSESIANNFIENIALKLFEVIPSNNICTDVFDFGHRKRFMHLASLQADNLYQIALTSNDASTKFNELEKIALHRHHELLSIKASTLSLYNQQNKFTEKYHLLLLNLEHYPDDLTSFKRLKEFLDSAYDAGFYCIAYGSQEIINSESKSTQYILDKLPSIEVINKKVILNKEVFEFAEMIQAYEFEYVNDNKDSIIEKFSEQLKGSSDELDEQDILSIPIGTTIDGQKEINFTLSDNSKNYHAFITGLPGSGKTVLLNHIITGIAEQFSAQQMHLFLMDYKNGVEFQVFNNHPNCEKIFLDNKDLQAAITLLEEFVGAMDKRATTFKEVTVKDISDYNKLYPDKPMERLVLIIDEVHELFSGGFKQSDNFTNLLKQVLTRGRAYGLHIILTTQTLSGTRIDKTLLNLIKLRLSFEVSSAIDSEMIFSLGNTEAANLGQYQFIYNNNSGKKQANILCRANPPVDKLNDKINTIIDTKDRKDCITPEIVESFEITNDSDKFEIKNNKNKRNKIQSNNYDTSEAKELLENLANDGKIDHPLGKE